MVWSASVWKRWRCADYRDIKAKTRTQFVLSQRTELEAINALQETLPLANAVKKAGCWNLP